MMKLGLFCIAINLKLIRKLQERQSNFYRATGFFFTIFNLKPKKLTEIARDSFEDLKSISVAFFIICLAYELLSSNV